MYLESASTEGLARGKPVYRSMLDRMHQTATKKAKGKAMESSRLDDILFSKTKLQEYDNECTDIYFLTQREVTVLLSLMRYAEWESRWVDRDIDGPLVQVLIRKLCMLCAEDLVKAQIATVAALTGRSIDLGDDAAIQEFLSSNLDFSEDGVVPAINRLSGVTDEEPDYTEELVAIGTILGAVVV